jgi:hypothetical protein
MSEIDAFLTQMQQQPATGKSQTNATPLPPGNVPAGPDTNALVPAPESAAPGPSSGSSPASVVVGYDSNNQPIFAAPTPTPAAAARVVVGYDANNQPIFAQPDPPKP